MDLDWCTHCDRHTDGGLYCSKECRLADAHTGSSADNSNSNPRSFPGDASSAQSLTDPATASAKTASSDNPDLYPTPASSPLVPRLVN
ncbi:MAG: hypothetical protein DHS80DRAFT_28619 [Piptocephalis tieghemiana]|nr:MAG: hypothetical protein DHS80DRAFT_28619 [Piptocephalis tieghemiana]